MSLARRRFIQQTSALILPALSGAEVAQPVQAPAVVTSERMRPKIASGVQTGDVGAGRGMIWSRSDRPARMFVEWSATPAFSSVNKIRAPYAMEITDFTARVDLTGLPPVESDCLRHANRPGG